MAFRPRHLFAFTAVAAMVLLPLPGGYDVFDTSIFLIVDDEVQDEDSYVASDRGVIRGTVDGDLVIATADLEIDGVVAGDVLVAASGSVVIRGEVRGAVRGIARSVVVEEGAIIGDDLAVVAIRTRVEGSVGRDSIVFGGRFDLEGGSIGRDVHGRFVRGIIDGGIGRNVDIGTSSLTIGPDADVDGSLLYRSNRAAETDSSASIAGQFARISPRPSFFVDVWWTLATILGFFSFVLTGIVLFWIFRDTSTNAVEAIAQRPWRTLGFGLATMVLVPVAVVTLVASLVGIPVAILLGVLYLLGFFFGPIPAVAALGARIPRMGGSVFAAFVAGAVVWRAALLVLGFVAGGLYVMALVWGVGGWVSAVWDGKRAYSAGAAETTAST